MNNRYKLITPHSLTQSVSFQRDKINWEYNPEDSSTMPNKQAEGSARLFNLLIEHGVALLADEVGMGKTIQSLAVIASLWQQKPNARVLVLAPRREIALNWINEYETFINVHYKHNDDIVKNMYGNKAMHEAHFCENLYDLAQQYKEIGKQFFVGKISSFSSLFSGNTEDRLKEIGIETEEDKPYNDSSADMANHIGNLLRKHLTDHRDHSLSDSEHAFDMVIIDEAHYFRNIDGGSLKVNAAKGFFGIDQTPLSDKYLLLTATPNHNSSNNIPSIFSYFKKKETKELSAQELLDRYAVRRFRRLSSKGYMKYNYRQEQPLVASFKDPMSEIFFGLYQKKLAMEYAKTTDKHKKNHMLNFLEGTEFIPQLQKHTSEEKDSEETQSNSGDFSTGADSDMLASLAMEYKEQFNDYPRHPKYDILIENLTGDLKNPSSKLNEKSLVFVRRIPSVKEIAGRVNLEYDKILWKKISIALSNGEREEIFPLKDLTRKSYQAYYDSIKKEDHQTEEDENTENDTNTQEDQTDMDDGFLGSKVLDLFKRQKKSDDKDNITNTHASNFRLRFSRSKPGIFPIFFAPAADYDEACYRNMLIIEKSYSNGKKDNDYYTSAIEHRLKEVETNDRHRLRELFGLKRKQKQETKDGGSEIQYENLLTIFWNHLKETDNEQYSKYSNIYTDFTVYEKEAFSNFLEKGVLLASSAIVDLYAIYIQNELELSTSNRITFYNNFTQKLKAQFADTILPKLIISALDRFKLICEKVFNLQRNDTLVQHKWDNFYNQNPAYPYWGATKNQRVLTSFNTPFFPDILISTSILQEGVNLQYYCNNIIHYGIAWTPGDNEQRVGRVDRMFGKIEKELEEATAEKASLKILYPYLQHTIDQDHVANFISKKYSEENRIDHCQTSEVDNKLNYDEANPDNWNSYFRSPIDTNDIKDPYGVDPKCFEEVPEHMLNHTESINIKEKIIKTIKDGGDIEIYQKGDTDQHSKEICVVNRTIEVDGKKREQPIFIEMEHCPIVSAIHGECVYLLALKTPLGKKKDCKDYQEKYNHSQTFQDKYKNQYITAKLCIDENHSAKSNFYMYMKIEIPMFPKSAFHELSSDEINTNINDLIYWADDLECSVFGETKDIQTSETDDTLTPIECKFSQTDGLREKDSSTTIADQWEEIGKFRRIIKDYRSTNEEPLEEWKRNHKMNLIKNFFRNDSQAIQVAYLGCDMQEKEQQVLEKTLEYWNKTSL